MLTVKTPEEVLRLLTEAFPAREDLTENVPLSAAAGRVLAQDVCASEYVPDFDRSTVDGYAVRASDTFGCSDAIPAILQLAGEVRMGEGADAALLPGCCIAVPTGGALPQGADCVVMLEYTEDYGDGTIGILKSGAPGANVIFRGDDVKPGKVILRSGRELLPQDVGALAAIGRTDVPVVRRLRVGVISTGDELVPPSETPGAGQVRDVNAPMLTALLRDFGAEPVHYGIIDDDAALLRETMTRAARECDAVLVSGGSSVGVKDAVCGIIESMGALLLHGIAVKPGKPTILGKTADAKPLVGLPGHPVAAYFMARLFVLPLLERIMGRERTEYTVAARLTESVNANHGRAQIMPCRLKRTDDGLKAVPVHSKSGLITQLAGADGFFVIPRDCEGLPAGAEVAVTLQ